ncbi:MAG: hypothetical protein IJI46_06810 [Erysipelotrichaceae bacterium]|nr:hypothetical protein [Erysipelotrichaceae bacterium]
MNEADLYKELGILTRDKDRWEESIPYVSTLLSDNSLKIQAKALWLLGEMGLKYPLKIEEVVPLIATFLNSSEPPLRSRAINAIGRIGRGDYHLIETCWKDLFRFAEDKEETVRLSFIWASENIAINNPELYKEQLSVFERLLYDKNEKVRMEAPEIFRVLGKRRPEYVMPYIERLQEVSQIDSNRVVKIHCLGAIKATLTKLDNTDEDDNILAEN